MTKMVEITWDRLSQDCLKLACRVKRTHDFAEVYGIPTGGCFVAMEVTRALGCKMVETPGPDTLIIDDLVDHGDTMRRYESHPWRTALYQKSHSPDLLTIPPIETLDGWVKFPWEVEHEPTDAVVRLLEYIGEDPKRDGLKNTPSRVLRALREMTSGHSLNPREILGTVFEESYDEVVILRGIPFASLCEHHLLPFTGVVHIGYIPGKVVGLSKLARLVDCYAHRLQVQEKLTRQIADSIKEHLEARGVAVIVKATHCCMSCRGVRKPGAEMITSTTLGAFRENAAARMEFLSLCS